MIGKTSFAKLTVAPPAAGYVAGASVAAGGSVGAAVSVEPAASVVGGTCSVGADVDAGVSVGELPQADNRPTIKTNSTNFKYVNFIFLSAPQRKLHGWVQDIQRKRISLCQRLILKTV